MAESKCRLLARDGYWELLEAEKGTKLKLRICQGDELAIYNKYLRHWQKDCNIPANQDFNKLLSEWCDQVDRVDPEDRNSKVVRFQEVILQLDPLPKNPIIKRSRVYYTIGMEIVGIWLDYIQKLDSACTCLQGFLISLSVCYGIGSVLVTLIYKDTNVCTILDKEAIYDISQTIVKNKCSIYINLNYLDKLIIQVITPLTFSLYFVENKFF